GWREQDPILLFGPPNQFLHTLDWYLPGDKRLEFATWTGGGCDRVFLVSVGGRARALVAGAPTRRVRRAVIARLPYRASFAGEVRRRHGRVLATRAVKCARVD
ncbi:MAG: hypothetical protein M3R39_06225, partial [Actinomycetota bacterium]|nr:hypothetical protein [Actinomycetota bacterium]